MNEAQHWRIVCDTRSASGFPSLVDDPWCRRTLSDAADHREPCGGDGTMWVFVDGSRLIANRNGVLVQPQATERTP